MSVHKRLASTIGKKTAEPDPYICTQARHSTIKKKGKSRQAYRYKNCASQHKEHHAIARDVHLCHKRITAHRENRTRARTRPSVSVCTTSAFPTQGKQNNSPARLSVYHKRVAAQRENTARARQRMSVLYHSASQHKKTKQEKKEPDTPIRDDVLTVAYIPEIQAVATKKQVTKRPDGIQTNIHSYVHRSTSRTQQKRYCRGCGAHLPSYLPNENKYQERSMVCTSYDNIRHSSTQGKTQQLEYPHDTTTTLNDAA